MNLVFYGRQTLPATATTRSTPVLTVERGGNICLSVGAAAALALAIDEPALLTQDTDTNTWYLLVDKRGFPLRARDKKKLTTPALQFYSRPLASLYYAAHGLGAQKSARADIGLVPLEHQGLRLYPLVPQHATKVPAVVEASPAAPVAEPSAPTPESPSTPDVASLSTDLPQLQPETSTPPMTASSVPAPTVGALPSSRAEQLTDYWYEREISNANEQELAEVIKVLGAVPKGDREFTENLVLNRAKTEQARRDKKKGSSRG